MIQVDLPKTHLSAYQRPSQLLLSEVVIPTTALLSGSRLFLPLKGPRFLEVYEGD